MERNVEEMKREYKKVMDAKEKVDNGDNTTITKELTLTMRDDINPVLFVYKYLLCLNCISLLIRILNNLFWHIDIIRYALFGGFIFIILTLIVVGIMDSHNHKIKMAKYAETLEMLETLKASAMELEERGKADVNVDKKSPVKRGRKPVKKDNGSNGKNE